MEKYYDNLLNQQCNHLIDVRSYIHTVLSYDLPIAVRDAIVVALNDLNYAVDICDIIRDACTDSNEG